MNQKILKGSLLLGSQNPPKTEKTTFTTIQTQQNPLRMFGNDDYICRHLQLTKTDLLHVIREKNLTTFEQIQDETDAATICATCVGDIEELLLEELTLRNQL